MNKQTLVEAVAAELKSTKSHAERAVDTVIRNLKKGLKKDKAVQLIGFGTFRLKLKKARRGWNPKTRTPLNIKASKTIGFKVSKEFKKTL
ncbi:MAG: HU family DNA-binding protein [Planctomycetota bacterium]|nr:HU family DNA-binding protein [Planctomycetota bacterium]